MFQQSTPNIPALEDIRTFQRRVDMAVVQEKTCADVVGSGAIEARYTAL
jgi:hypothetical protein